MLDDFQPGQKITDPVMNFCMLAATFSFKTVASMTSFATVTVEVPSKDKKKLEDLSNHKVC
jgi:hypothetical protein